MPRCRVVKGGWSWKGEVQQVGTIITESAAWIGNRVADGGLVEPIADEPEIETATAKPEAETAISPRGRARSK